MLIGPERVRALRAELGLGTYKFARIIGADIRSVFRWESGKTTPRGSTAQVMIAFETALKRCSKKKDIIAFIVDATAAGGLAFLLVKLFDAFFEKLKTTKGTKCPQKSR